jgi:hypothetical protein
MLACLSPSDSNFDDNLSTLQYATKARSIRNAPQVNMDPKSALIMRLQEEVANLRRRLRDAHTYIVKVTGSLPDFLRDGSKYTPEAAEKAMKAMAPVSAATNDAQQETTTVGKASPAPKGDVRLASGDLMASSDPAEGDGRVGRDDPKAKGRVQGTKDALPQVGELRDSRPAERDRRAPAAEAAERRASGPEWSRFDAQSLGERLAESVRVLGDAVEENGQLRSRMDAMTAQIANQQRQIEELARENVDLRESNAYLEAAATSERGAESITKLSTIHDSLLFQILQLRKEASAAKRNAS